jgi:hypothetical protein
MRVDLALCGVREIDTDLPERRRMVLDQVMDVLLTRLTAGPTPSVAR